MRQTPVRSKFYNAGNAAISACSEARATLRLGAPSNTAIPGKKPKIYHCCKFDPDHKAWGIYSRAKKAAPTKPFWLDAIHFDFEAAKELAQKLTETNPKRDYSIQGAPTSSHLPARYDP